MESKNFLSEDEQKLFSKILSTEPENVKYPFDQEFQRVLVGMLLCDRFFLSQCIGLVDPNYFLSEVHQFLAKFVFAFFDQYNHLPSKVFTKEAVSEFLATKTKYKPENLAILETLYLGELEAVYLYYSRGGVGTMMPGLDSPEALLDKITLFAKNQAMKSALQKSFELLKRKPEDDEIWGTIGDYVKEAQLVDRRFDFGLDYFNTAEERYARMEENDKITDVFSTGFPLLDAGVTGGGIQRGELGAVMALPGRGKSLNLALASLMNIQKGHKVLYITTEMNPDRVAARFDAMISQVGQNRLLMDKEQVWKAIKDEVKEYDDKKRLFIKQFPSGSGDMSTVYALHSQLSLVGFRPDLMVIDYPGDFKETRGISTWESLFRTIRDLRGFGAEEKHCTLVAIQPNRGAANPDLDIDDFLDENSQGGSFNQNYVFDLFWTLNQTLNEKKACVGRVYVAKARSGKSHYSFNIHYDFENQTLMLRHIGKHAYDLRMAEVATQNIDETNENMTRAANSQVKVFKATEGEQIM